LNIMGVQRIDGDNYVYDDSEAQHEISQRLFERAPEVLRANIQNNQIEKTLAEKSAAEVRDDAREFLQKAFIADETANSGPVRQIFAERATEVLVSLVSVPVQKSSDLFTWVRNISQSTGQYFTDLRQNFAEYRQARQELREKAPEFEEQLPEQSKEALDAVESTIRNVDYKEQLDELQRQFDEGEAPSIDTNLTLMQRMQSWFRKWSGTDAVREASPEEGARIVLETDTETFTELESDARDLRESQEESSMEEDSIQEDVPQNLREDLSAVHEASLIKLDAPNSEPYAKIDNEGAVQPDAQEVSAVNAEVRARRAEMLERLIGESTGPEAALYADTFLDPMTGHLNRAGLRFLDSMIARGSAMSVISYDGDHFGAFNTILSEDFGDHLIRIMGLEFHRMANELRAQFPDATIEVIRMGGEEFVVFAENVPLETLRLAQEAMNARLKERIRNDVLTDQQVSALGDYAYATKYDPTVGKDPADITDLDRAQASALRTQAFNEIGGSTAGVLEYDLSSFRQEAQELGYENTRANILQYTDQWLEFGKNRAGRGAVYESEQVPNRRTNDTERLFDFRAKNELSETQNTNIEDFSCFLVLI
jgi:GGDEF domain-containing protein